MPETLSIHGLDASTAKLLAVYANRRSKSLNQAVKDLLAAALGSSAAAKTKGGNGLRRFRGCVSSHDADALLEFVSNADFSQLDEEDEA